MKFYVIMILLAAAHLIGHFQYVNSFSKKPTQIKRLDKEVQEKNEQYLSAKIVSENLEGVSKLLKRNLAATDRDSLVLREEVYLLQQITNKMEENKLQVVRIDPKPHQRERTFVRKPYLLNFIGTYQNIVNFVSSLEKMDRMISVERLDIQDNTTFAQKITALEELDNLQLHEVKMNINALTIIKRG